MRETTTKNRGKYHWVGLEDSIPPSFWTILLFIFFGKDYTRRNVFRKAVSMTGMSDDVSFSLKNGMEDGPRVDWDRKVEKDGGGKGRSERSP